MNSKKQKNILRKSSAYGLTGVVLFSGLLMGNSASADELNPSVDNQAVSGVLTTSPGVSDEHFVTDNTATINALDTTMTATPASGVVETAPTMNVNSTTVSTLEVIKETANIPIPEVKEVEPIVLKNETPTPKVSINNDTPKTPKEEPVSIHDNEVTVGVNELNVINPNERIDTGASNATGQVTLNAKSSTTTETVESTTIEHHPMDLIAILDLSASVWNNEFEGTPTGTSGDSFRSNLAITKDLIERGLTDNDHVMFAMYYTNNEKSYEVGGTYKGDASNLLSKSDALKYLEKMISESQSEEFPSFEKTDMDYKGKAGGFEEVYNSFSNKNERVSVIQFTDGWGKDEAIDTTFADWATKNAKTFMSIIRTPDASKGNSLSSTTSMKKAGHPNIYFAQVGNDDKTKGDVLEAFKNTAVEKKTSTTVNKTVKQNVELSLVSDNGVRITSVSLIRPNGISENLTVSNGQVVFKQEQAEDGEYTLKYNFEGSGSITVLGKVDGKEVINKKESLAKRASVILKVEDSSGKEILSESVLTAIEGSDYSLKSPTAEGYHISLKENSAPSVGKVGNSDTIVTYVVSPIAGTVKSMFLDRDGGELAPTKILASDKLGMDWSSLAPTEITKDNVVYRLSSKPSTEYGKLGTETVVLKYQYTPKKYARTVFLRVLNALDNSEILGKTPVVSGWQGETYEANAPTLNGWKLELAENTLVGTFGDSDTVITYKAKQEAGTVSSTYKDNNGTELAPTNIVSKDGYVGDAWSLDSIPAFLEVSGKKYLLSSKSKVINGNLTTDNLVLPMTYDRERAGTITAKFVGTGGVQLAGDLIISKDGFTSDTWKVEDFPKEFVIDGKKWLLTSVPVDMNGILDLNDVTLTFEYSREKAGKVIAKFINSEGESILSDEIVSQNGFTGDSWKASEPADKVEFNGKVYVLNKSPQKTNGLLGINDLTLTYEYVREKAGKVVAKFINEEGVVISKDITVSENGYTRDRWEMTQNIPQKVEFNGKVYILKTVPKETLGILGVDDVVLTFEYAREKAGKVVVKFVDEIGREISKEIVVSEGGYTNDLWKFSDKAPTEIEFEGKVYTLNVSPKELKGFLGINDITLKFIYKEKSTPVEHTVVESSKTSQPVYNTTQKTLPKTGFESNIATSVMGIVTGLFAFWVAHKRK